MRDAGGTSHASPHESGTVLGVVSATTCQAYDRTASQDEISLNAFVAVPSE